LTNYQYIHDLFKGILASSQAIEGRFVIGYRYGLQEINYDQLGQVVDAFDASKKYPLVVMAPPHSTVDFGGHNAGWETYRIIMFFLKKSFNNSDNTVQQIHSLTGTSQHRVYQDWHDMKRCCVNFVQALLSVQAGMRPAPFNYPTQQHALCIPVSNIGADRAAGVRYDFDFRLFLGCEIEDYAEYPTTLELELDGHPQHSL